MTDHGYGVGKWMRDTTRDALQVKEGALHPALHRLERKAFLAEDWGISKTGREAKYYTLASAGRKHLHAEDLRWTRYALAVSAALNASPA
ncbi:MAG TPA: helix-turn-helix transcriptional regulator [Gemmatimonadaceae bacterium]|nr:helix-turn-helix transcriptional regulator [Gemmatimonadaceae bacterium]